MTPTLALILFVSSTATLAGLLAAIRAFPPSHETRRRRWMALAIVALLLALALTLVASLVASEVI